MNCIGFPKMFNANSTIIKTGLDATKTCVHLLLSSEQGQLFGDPDFGVRIKRFAFEQNNYILRDIIIDELFSNNLILKDKIFDFELVSTSANTQEIYHQVLDAFRKDYKPIQCYLPSKINKREN